MTPQRIVHKLLISSRSPTMRARQIYMLLLFFVRNGEWEREWGGWKG